MRIRKNSAIKWLIAISVMFITSESVMAAPLNCSGKVYAVLIYKDGEVIISTTYRNNYTGMCNLSAERQGVSIQTCALWAASLQKAKIENRDISVYYDTDASFSSCADIPTYSSSPAPIYIAF